MNFNYEQTLTDIEALEKCQETLSDEKLLSIAKAATENFTQISITLAMPHFLMSESVRSVKYFQYILEGAVATKNQLQPKSPEKKKELDEYVDKQFKANAKNHSEEGRDLLNNLRTKNPYIEKAIKSQALNSLVNVWTLFESCSKEIWVHLLNNFQSLFLNNILEAKSEQDIEGISGKNISISFLGKYGFNINNKLGDILSGKYDFTSCIGIKKAFTDLDKTQKDALIFLEDKNLFRLELIRNLIVHNAGIIDEPYLRRSADTTQLLGEKIQVDTNNFSDYENSAIHAIANILKLANDKTTANKSIVASGAEL